MSVQVENLEKNTAKLTIEVPAEKFEEAVQHSYNKNKGKFNIPGFRKGKAPFNMIKKMYGVGVFYEDAVDGGIVQCDKLARSCESLLQEFVNHSRMIVAINLDINNRNVSTVSYPGCRSASVLPYCRSLSIRLLIGHLLH